jgi:hypothetical protein|tara:strand:- start:101 stop:286 length:186 start_codon:yes stop_codon:yes gene_type:complete
MTSKDFKKEYNLGEFNNTFSPMDESDDIELAKQHEKNYGKSETLKAIKSLKDSYWEGLGNK